MTKERLGELSGDHAAERGPRPDGAARADNREPLRSLNFTIRTGIENALSATDPQSPTPASTTHLLIFDEARLNPPHQSGNLIFIDE
jgi:hypothetical protein